MKEVEATVATMARIPPKTVSKSDTELLRNLESDLKRVVFGQDKAIEALSAAIKLAACGPARRREAHRQLPVLRPDRRRQDRGRAPARKPCSASSSSASTCRNTWSGTRVSRLIGAPPGYVGFDQGGLLTDGVDQHPHCVLLLDEIEKAHPDLFNVLLQVMDHGKLTDHNGKQVDFRNVILIMTTNAGAAEMAKSAIGFGGTQRTGEDEEAIKRMFTPEFRNRLDAVIAFARLSREMISKVVEKFIFQLEAQLADRNVMIEVSPEAMEWIAEPRLRRALRRAAARSRHPGAHQEAAGRGAAVRQARRRRNGSHCRGRKGWREGALVRDHRDQAAGQGGGSRQRRGWRWRRPHAGDAYSEGAADPVIAREPASGLGWNGPFRRWPYAPQRAAHVNVRRRGD